MLLFKWIITDNIEKTTQTHTHTHTHIHTHTHTHTHTHIWRTDCFCQIKIPSQRRTDLETNNIETLCIEVRLGKVKWLIANCYNNPSIQDKDFKHIWCHF